MVARQVSAKTERLLVVDARHLIIDGIDPLERRHESAAQAECKQAMSKPVTFKDPARRRDRRRIDARCAETDLACAHRDREASAFSHRDRPRRRARSKLRTGDHPARWKGHLSLLLPKPREVTGQALTMLVRGMRPGITVHGFRSNFRDWVAEKTSYANELAEMALGHAIGDAVEAAYRRGDMFERRRQLMDDWATGCTSR